MDDELVGGPAPPSPNDHEVDGHDAGWNEDLGRARRRWPRVVAVVAIVAVLASWSFATWFSLNRTGPEPVDEASRAALDSICTDSALALEALRDARFDDPLELRAALVVEENRVFARMLDAVERVTPTDVDGRRALRSWVADWRSLLVERSDFAVALVSESPHRLLVPVDGRGRPVTVRMDEFAGFHNLAVCSPLSLAAETVDGPRTRAPIELAA